MRTIRVTSVFPASVGVVWEKLRQLSTLQYIAFPYATFKPQGECELVWQAGAVLRFSFRLFGVVPLGIHTIRVVRLDRETLTVETEEGNRHVPVWNHRIHLEKVGETLTRYTDEVEIGAGWKTAVVALWSRLFYRHRQRKWRKLLRSG